MGKIESPQATAYPEGGNAQFSRLLAVQRVILLLALAAVGLVLLFPLYQDYQSLLGSQGKRLSHQARVIEKNLSVQLDVVNQTLKMIADQWPGAAAKDDPKVIDSRLQSLDIATAGMRVFLVLDPEGVVRNSNRPELVGKNLSDREYFRVVKADPADRLHILSPFKTLYGYYVLPMARAIRSPSGEFLGVVAISLDTEFFRTLVSSVLYAPDMWGHIAHSGGSLFLHTPGREEMIGLNIAVPGSFFTRHKESGQPESVFSGIVYATGEDRLVALRDVRPSDPASEGYMVVAISRDLKEIYGPLRARMWLQGGLLAALILSSTLLLYAYQRRQRALRMRFEESSRAVAEANAEVDKFFTMSTELLSIVDVEGRFRRTNSTWETILGYSSEDMAKLRFIDLVHPDDRKFCEDTAATLLTGAPVLDFVVRTKTKAGDYRLIEWRSTGFDEGLSFTVARDVTDQRAAQADREKLIAELTEALADVKTLSGLLPICSCCKKIRDDQGYWNHLEKYIMEHSGARFTHGLCPDCVMKLYPELKNEL